MSTTEKTLIAKAMSILGSRKSPAKAAASRANGLKRRDMVLAANKAKLEEAGEVPIKSKADIKREKHRARAKRQRERRKLARQNAKLVA